MPKVITSEMLHAMTPVQLSTLRDNATARDTPAARDLLKLLSEEGLIKPAKVATVASASRKAAPKRAAKATATPKAAPIAHGRRA